MTLNEIRAAHPEWTDITTVEAWLRQVARETCEETVTDEYGVEADAAGEYTLTAEQAAAIIAMQAE